MADSGEPKIDLTGKLAIFLDVLTQKSGVAPEDAVAAVGFCLSEALARVTDPYRRELLFRSTAMAIEEAIQKAPSEEEAAPQEELSRAADTIH